MGFLGAAVGAALTGLRPVVDLMFAEFLGVAFDQLVTEASFMHYLSGGRLRVPLTIRASMGSGLGFGCQHSQTIERWLLGTPGLKVVVASGASSAYSLLRTAIRQDDPVVMLEPRVLYGEREEVERGSRAVVPLGSANVVATGSDITLVALGQTVRIALRAAAVSSGFAADVIDLRSLMPWDKRTVMESVTRTGRLVLIEENQFTGGWGTEIASFVGTYAFEFLKAPILRITAPDAPVPYGVEMERRYLPSPRAPAPDRAYPASLVGEGEVSHVPASAAIQAERRRSLRESPRARYECMVAIRLFEDKLVEMFGQGAIAGTMHTSQGQEAVAVGIAAATDVSDIVTCTYRGHGVALALGMTREAVLAEILGRRSGCMGGLGGSMHLSDPGVGLLPTFAIVGAGFPVAVGAGLSAQLLHTGSVAIAIFGDAATNIGAFHEGLNLASIWKLPVVFVCENNLYGSHSPLGVTTPITDLASRAASYAMASEIVDGQDVDLVQAAVARAAARARGGGGPTLIEAKTYRYVGHSRSDPASYRPAGELESWLARDPIELLGRKLMDERVLNRADLTEIRQTQQRLLEETAELAMQEPAPEPADMLRHVYASPAGEATAEVSNAPHGGSTNFR
jgi:pyruvate dehydrogenase E1 component alpha subunit